MSADEDHDPTAFIGSDSGKIQDDLSPDLPPKEALYLFIGFSSYMRAPLQGSEGLDGASAFKDAVRLLEHARVNYLYPMSHADNLRTLPYNRCQMSISYTSSTVSAALATAHQWPNQVEMRI